MRKSIFTAKWFKEFEELQRKERAQATSIKQKRQASSSKLRYTPTGILLGVDLGDKPQASSESKPEPVQVQASSAKRQASQPE